MRWFFGTFAALVAVLFLSFVAWIVTRALHAEVANDLVGQIMIGDLCAFALLLAYSAFSGGWQRWEKLAGSITIEGSRQAIALSASHDDPSSASEPTPDAAA
jgi:small-conductance mechanosensitive channel